MTHIDGFQRAIDCLHDVGARTGSPAAIWAADYLDVDSDGWRPVVTTYEEWRVTGDPSEGFPPYQFTFSPLRGDDDPEAAARHFVMIAASDRYPWRDGPHLHKRTVTVTEWEAIEP